VSGKGKAPQSGHGSNAKKGLCSHATRPSENVTGGDSAGLCGSGGLSRANLTKSCTEFYGVGVERKCAVHGAVYRHVTAGHGADTGVAEIESFSLWQADRVSSQGLVYTDRPVYRPGQKIYFKGIARQVAGGQYALG